MRNFLVWMLGWWIGFFVAGAAAAFIAVEVAGMSSESDTYALILFPAVIVGGLVGARLTSRRWSKPRPSEPPVVP